MMREQDFIAARPGLRERLNLISTRARAAGAAAASAATVAACAFVLAVLSPMPASGAVLGAAQGLYVQADVA